MNFKCQFCSPNWTLFERLIEDHHWPGKAPHGYKNALLSDGIERTIVPDENEAHLIKRLYELYSTGTYSYKSLSAELYELGLKTSRDTALPASAIEHILNNPFYYGVMRYKGRENSHDYEPLVTKALFDKCQAVRVRWNKQPFQYAAKPMVFRGVIACKNCGCAISGEVKKGRLVYYSCSNYRKKCQRVYVREESLLEPIYPILEGIQMSDQRIKEVVEGMKQLGESEHQFHGDSMHGLKREYDERGEEIYKAYKDQLSGRITQDMYDRLVLENKARQAEILEKMGKHNVADKTFYITANRIFKAVQRAREIFEGSEADEKRDFLNMLLQNATLDGKKLEFTVRSPFQTIYETRNQPIGLRG